MTYFLSFVIRKKEIFSLVTRDPLFFSVGDPPPRTTLFRGICQLKKPPASEIKKLRDIVFALFPSQATRASRLSRFRLCSPKIRKQITPVLQARAKQKDSDVNKTKRN